MKLYTLIFIICCFLLFINVNGQHTYSKETEAQSDVFFNDMTLTTNGNTILSHTDPETGNLSNTCLLKLTDKGKVLWAKKFLFYSTTYNNTIKIIPSQNEDFVALNAITYYEDFSGSLIFKADGNGNIKWSKRLSLHSNKHHAIPESVAEAKDGSLYVVTRVYDDGIYIHKFDSNGLPLWHQYIHTDSTIDIQTQVGPLSTTPDNGLIISTISFGRYKDRYFSNLLKLSKDGQPEWEYTSNQAFDYYIPLLMIQSTDMSELRLLYSRYNHYNYVRLNTITGKSDAYDAGETIFDLQSYLRNQAIHSFDNVPFSVPSYTVYAFTSNWNIINAYSFRATRTKYRARIEKYDSLGRICPDYKLPKLDSSLGKFRFNFTKSAFQVSDAPLEFLISDTTISVQSFDIIRTLCAGETPALITGALIPALYKKEMTLEMKITPTPAKTCISISVNLPAHCISKIDLTSLNGVILKSVMLSMIKGQNKKTINIADLPTGIYILKMLTPAGVLTKKIIKL